MSVTLKDLEDIIRESLFDTENLVKAGTDNDTLKVIFPKYSDGRIRYSEQELKQIFLRNLESTCFSYSVETPSKFKYSFKNKDPEVTFIGECGFQSAMIDVSVYNNGKLLSHIEFKYGQCELFAIRKDFLKLLCEENSEHNYFVHYFSSFNDKTRECILKKYRTALENIRQKNTNIENLESRLQQSSVYLYLIGKNSKPIVSSFEEFLKG